MNTGVVSWQKWREIQDILDRVHKLYGFDVIKDTVNDVMHVVPMNVVKRQIIDLISDEKIDRELVGLKLDSFPWTSGTLCNIHIYL